MLTSRQNLPGSSETSIQFVLLHCFTSPAARLTFPLQTKKITLVHSGTLPLNDAYPAKFRVDVLRRWKARNIDVVLGDRIDEIPTASPIVIKTANGKSIETDIVVCEQFFFDASC